MRIDDAVVESGVIQCPKDGAVSILYESYRFPDRLGNAPSPASPDVPFVDFQRRRRTDFHVGSLGLFRNRQRFASKLRDRGIEANATPARARGIDPAPEAIAARKKDGPGARRFIARRPPHSWAIVDFDETWALLAVRGFSMIEREKLEFLEQFALFRKARIAVGQMGAAMTRGLFCRPATSLTRLALRGWISPFYLELAALGGQQYDIPFALRRGGADPPVRFLGATGAARRTARLHGVGAA